MINTEGCEAGKISPYRVDRYRLRLDHDVMIEEGGPEDPGAPIYMRAEPPLAIDIHVDTAACIPKDEILDMLLRRLKEGCFAKWSEEQTLT